MTPNTVEFQKKFEELLSADFVMLDNTSNIVWKDGNPGYFLIVVSPKSEEVYDQIKEHAVKTIREIRSKLLFKAEAQELGVNGMKSMVFKVTPLRPKTRPQSSR